jgi:hypothetical protein
MPTATDNAPDIVFDELDIIWGVEAIAKAIGRSQRQTFWILEKKLIPARKVGRLWAVSRRGLRAHFEKAA